VAAEGDRQRKQQDELLAGLDESQRILFNSFRQWRNQIATKEGVSHYLILKNRQVVELIRKRPQSLTALSQFDGIGPKKVEKYGQDILRLLAQPAEGQETAR
jgi:ATP-dependent DNA helicase RecQ